MKLQKIISSTIVLSAVFVAGFATQAFADVKGAIKGNNVNVRESNDTSAQKVDTLNDGQEVKILEVNNDWYKVSYDGVDSAYVSTQFITISEAIGHISNNDVNVRSNASTAASVVAKVNSGDTVVVTAQDSSWYQIRRSNGETAYINKAYVNGDFISSVENFSGGEAIAVDVYAIVTASSGLRLRETPSADGSVIKTLAYEEVVDVVEVGTEWIKVKTDAGQEGYVSSQYVAVRTGEKPSRSISSSKGAQIVEYGKQFLGTPYSWGGTDLNRGVDCSGFVYAVMSNFGIKLNRSSASMASNGVYVERANLQAGDLVFFDTTNATNQGYISHVGIYMGNNMIIHSSSGKQWGITTNSLSETYYNTKYVTARRVIR